MTRLMLEGSRIGGGISLHLMQAASRYAPRCVEIGRNEPPYLRAQLNKLEILTLARTMLQGSVPEVLRTFTSLVQCSLCGEHGPLCLGLWRRRR